MALGYVGISDRIESFEDRCPVAALCKTYYNPVRQQLLSEFPWNFAASFCALSQLDLTHPDYSFVYAYPKTALRINRIAGKTENNAPCKNARFKTARAENETAIIATDVFTAFAFYTHDMTNTKDFPMPFAEALSLRLASSIICSVTGAGSLSARGQLIQIAENAVIKAQILDANQNREAQEAFIGGFLEEF